ncbi:hypothetical protein [Pontiella sulfatireligans]|uniref:Uncharacterized protein n=1 Tax=Pontiella sulfatireligans TaxID=2750658 RepID=A0A6C2USH6_9BACT|nr:hypothetical protein [Pontiella sulfatireligans]VGO23290.1 hypothetical protein SCARR_05397 [Pontiella sulfatireligans]
MEKRASLLIIAASVLIALTSISFAVKAGKQRKLAEAEIQALQQKLAAQKDRAPRRRSPAPKPVLTAEATADGTNALVVLQTAPNVAEEEPKKERESFEDRMARMKDEDPEGYAEMIQKKEERQQQMRYNLAERTATFMDLDTSNMTEEERATHEQLVEKMARVWELSAQFQDPEQPPDREAMKELFTEMNDVRPLLTQERTVMFKQLGTDLGYEGEEAQDFATHVEDIIDATSIRMPSGGRGGPGGGGRGGGGGR